MKKIKLIVLLMCFASVAFSQFKKEFSPFNKIADAERRSHSYINQKILSASGDNYDVKYHRCNWYIDPAVSYISGSVTTYFTSVINNLSQVTFDLSNFLTVDSVVHSGVSAAFTQLSGSALQINLPNTLSQNQLDSVTIYYHGVPNSTGFGSFNQSTHASTPVLWTLSQPDGSSDWWPCKNTLTDKIDSIDIIVTTPQAYRCGSNGSLIEELQSGTNKIYHWQSHYPISAYLVAIAVTNYAVYSDYVPLTNDSLEVLNYVYPEHLSTAQPLTANLVQVIQFFDSLTILYPFAKEKYGHAEFSWGGGMEHQTMTYVDAFDIWLLAHELAHQWFGDMITCGSWEDIWLNEGFATYFEGLTEERFYPATWYGWKWNAISNITSQPDGSVLCDDTTNIWRIFDGRLSYNKGSYLLHMLRWQLGDSIFFHGLRNYLNDSTLAYNYAKTPVFKQHLENISGQSLTKFFDQWYYKQGYPSYQIRWYQSGNTLTLKINQTQSHPSVTYFEMPLPIRIQGAGFDTILVFDNHFDGQVFTATIASPVTNLSFDPDLWILSANNAVTYDISLALDEINLSGDVSVFPNPASDQLNILFHKNNFSQLEISMYDNLGRIIYHDSQQAFYSNNKIISINSSSFQNGIYQLVIQTDKAIICKKLQVRK